MKKILYVAALAAALCATDVSAAMGRDSKESMMLRASYSLPRRDGDEFRRTLHEADEENAQLMQRIRQARGELYDILTAPEFNQRAFEWKSAELRRLVEQTKQNRDEAFAAAAGQLNHRQRVTLAQAFEREMERGGMPRARHRR